MTSVLFALEWLPSYRRQLLDELREQMAKDGVNIHLVHGQPPSSKASRSTHVDLPWATLRENRTIAFKGHEFCIQPIADLVKQHDLVVVQQEAKLWLNLRLATKTLRPRTGWAMWGHGQHFNPHETSAVAEKLKRWETRRCDHFFAYTETSRKRVLEVGLPSDKVTVINNTVPPANTDDVAPEIELLATQIEARTKHVGILMSSLDQWKRLPFLVEVLQSIRSRIPDFEFIVAGAGDHDDPLRALARDNSWVHMVGVQFDGNKARLAAASLVTIHPGLVGLHIVESFRLGCPLVTTNVDYHSHELDYLRSGVNGVMVREANDVEEMSSAVVRVLTDDSWREQLIAGGKASSNELSLQAEIDHFANGLRKALR